MNGSALNEARQLVSQLIGMIRRGDMSLSKLRKLLDISNAKLAGYEKALNFLEQRDPETWTHDQAEEVMRIASGCADELMSRWQWDHMLRHHQLQLRADYVAIFKEGQAAFTEAKQELLSEIDKKEQEQAKRRAEELRRSEVQTKRRASGQCVMCGQPLGFFQKLLGKDRHNSCSRFKE